MIFHNPTNERDIMLIFKQDPGYNRQWLYEALDLTFEGIDSEKLKIDVLRVFGQNLKSETLCFFGIDSFKHEV